MKKNVILILVSNRSKSAITVQKLLTEYGCIIKTRLGIHDGVENVCSECGLVMIELAGSDKKAKELYNKLSVVKGVSAKLASLKMNI